MELQINTKNQDMTVSLIGELDEHSAPFVRRKFDIALTENNFKSVTLDLARLSFMDSTGIGVIIGRYKILKHNNIPFYVKNTSPTIDKIFKMSGLYEIVHKI